MNADESNPACGDDIRRPSIAKTAKEQWDYLVLTLNDFDFELCLWKFDALRIPELRFVAVNDAVKAQMVFVATHGTGELPSEVKVWIEQWLNRTEQKRDAARLLTLLSDPLPLDKFGASAFSQFAYLQQVARKGAMDFLVSTAPGVTRYAQSEHGLCVGLFPPSSGQFESLLDDMAVAAFDFARPDG